MAVFPQVAGQGGLPGGMGRPRLPHIWLKNKKIKLAHSDTGTKEEIDIISWWIRQIHLTKWKMHGCTLQIMPSSAAVDRVFSLLNYNQSETARVFAGRPASTSPDAAVH